MTFEPSQFVASKLLAVAALAHCAESTGWPTRRATHSIIWSTKK
jgi:hypothetical protein